MDLNTSVRGVQRFKINVRIHNQFQVKAGLSTKRQSGKAGKARRAPKHTRQTERDQARPNTYLKTTVSVCELLLLYLECWLHASIFSWPAKLVRFITVLVRVGSMPSCEWFNEVVRDVIKRRVASRTIITLCSKEMILREKKIGKIFFVSKYLSNHVIRDGGDHSRLRLQTIQTHALGPQNMLSYNNSGPD